MASATHSINDQAMTSLNTHPSNAEQARAFTAPSSLSFPGGAGDLTPPSDREGLNIAGAQGANGKKDNTATPANGVNPATPVATPGAGATGPGVSGIVPTLQ